MMVIKNSRLRTLLRYGLPFVGIPLLVILGALVFRGRQYLLISLGVAAMALLCFVAGFERKKTGARRLVLVAVMTALSIAGRFIPLFKPVTALTILTALYLGGESGFLVGALSALLSNFSFGQGPWTAFQMLAWGMIGLVAGYLAGPLKKHRWLLLLYGLVSGVVYSLLMDVWTVLWVDGGFQGGMYRSVILAALPHTALYALSNVAFLWLLAKPIGEKLERIRIKYGV
ncbi:MAG: ECF transporter S component [Clostridia bacterium]|nr:ECF transporter S component [Clostridia bacterium]